MRGLLRNGYVNQLLSETRAGIPGMRTLNADALTRARANNSALERALLGSWRDASPDVARVRLAFVPRLQPLTGPAAATGAEDTALYGYAPPAAGSRGAAAAGGIAIVAWPRS